MGWLMLLLVVSALFAALSDRTEAKEGGSKNVECHCVLGGKGEGGAPSGI